LAVQREGPRKVKKCTVGVEMADTQLTASQSATHTIALGDSNLVSSTTNNNLTRIAASQCIRSNLQSDR